MLFFGPTEECSFDESFLEADGDASSDTLLLQECEQLISFLETRDDLQPLW
jgi:hypothetical protein